MKNVTISASLLNSWAYIWQASEEYQEEALASLKNYLYRIKTPPSWQMTRGIDFEDLAIAGQVPTFSPIIAGGQYQVYAEKVYKIAGLNVKLRGYVDVVKAGQIYDLKRTTRYEFPKYIDSYQHWCYFALIPEAYKFTYLVGSGYSKAPYDNTVNFHYEEYYNDGQADARVIQAINQFITWLKMMNLYEVYINNFQYEKADLKIENEEE